MLQFEANRTETMSENLTSKKLKTDSCDPAVTIVAMKDE